MTDKLLNEHLNDIERRENEFDDWMERSIASIKSRAREIMMCTDTFYDCYEVMDVAVNDPEYAKALNSSLFHRSDALLGKLIRNAAMKLAAQSLGLEDLL